jgi:hypothetical protein
MLMGNGVEFMRERDGVMGTQEAIFTFFRLRTARIVLRSSPVSLVVLRNPRAQISGSF